MAKEIGEADKLKRLYLNRLHELRTPSPPWGWGETEFDSDPNMTKRP